MLVPAWLRDVVTQTIPDTEFDEGYTARRLIVVHSTEAPEARGSAAGSAQWLASNRGGAASAHFVIDAYDVVLCVDPDNSSWAAPGVNDVAINIEQAGYASQTAAEWQDAFSRATILNTARVARRVADHYGIPLQFVDAPGILRGARGVTTHAEVTKAYPKLGTGHTDPGTNYPMNGMLALARGDTTQGDIMALSNEDLDNIAARVLTARLSTNAGQLSLAELTTDSLLILRSLSGKVDALAKTVAAIQARGGVADIRITVNGKEV